LKITNRKRAGRVAQVTERLSSQIKKKKKKEIKKKIIIKEWEGGKEKGKCLKK
jgi:hypothetical protein